MKTEELVGFFSLAFALLSLVISIYFSRRTERATRLQQRGQLIDLNFSYYAKVQEWADRAIDSLTEAIFQCDLDPNDIPAGDYFRMWISSRQKISALVDQGRFFFPNELPEVYGSDKELAYRGLRPVTLSHLKHAFDLLPDRRDEQANIVRNEKSETVREIRGQLWDLRRKFVSEVQAILDPRTRSAELEELLFEVNTEKRGSSGSQH